MRLTHLYTGNLLLEDEEPLDDTSDQWDDPNRPPTNLDEAVAYINARVAENQEIENNDPHLENGVPIKFTRYYFVRQAFDRAASLFNWDRELIWALADRLGIK